MRGGSLAGSIHEMSDINVRAAFGMGGATYLNSRTGQGTNSPRLALYKSSNFVQESHSLQPLATATALL